jgi:hypothetical protein
LTAFPAVGAPAETWALEPLAVGGGDELVGLIGLVGLVVVGAVAVELLFAACRAGAGERLVPVALARAGCAVLAVTLAEPAVGLVGTMAAGCTGLVGVPVGPVLAGGVVAMPVALAGAGLVGLGAAEEAAVTTAPVTARGRGTRRARGDHAGGPGDVRSRG